MPVGLVLIMAVVMALGVPRIRLRLPVPDASPPGQLPGLAAADAAAVSR